ncbi:MAG: hypothetical protein VX777_03195 [Chlamydiota bacterium]|nr:hypothetical protein [Chlamydiota bacterium]
MLKDSTYKEKLAILKEIIPTIVDDIKKDLKNDHLKKDWSFTKTHFNTKNVNKLTSEELANGYINAIDNGADAEAIGEFFANRWLLKNTDLYYFFEQRLEQVASDFNEIEVLEDSTAKSLMEDSISKFGAVKSYIFSVFNSVVFPESTYADFKALATKEKESAAKNKVAQEEASDWKTKEKSYQQQMARMEEKYEKKLLGMQKKYDKDVEMLKKQVANLQRKLGNI